MPRNRMAAGSFIEDSNSTRARSRWGMLPPTLSRTEIVAPASVEPRQAAISSAAPIGIASPSPGARLAPLAELSHQMAPPRVRVEIATPPTASSRP